MVFTYIFFLILNWRKKNVHVFSFIILFLSLLSISYLSIIKNFDYFSYSSQTRVFQDRIKADTLSIRLDQYKNAINIIAKNFFGFGSYESSNYYQACAQIGQLYYVDIFDYDSRQKTGKRLRGYIVHNGFLGAGTLYGIMGLITFLLFCTSAVWYAHRQYMQSKDNNSMALIIVCIVWLLYQTTQDFSDLSAYHAVLFGIILSTSKKNYIPNSTKL